MAIAIAVITLGYVVLSYVGISAGPGASGAWLPPDQFHAHPAWHRAAQPGRRDDPMAGWV